MAALASGPAAAQYQPAPNPSPPGQPAATPPGAQPPPGYPPPAASGNQWRQPGDSGQPGYDPYANEKLQLAYYGDQKKSTGTGLLFELLLPGGGGFYSENHLGGALVLAGTLVGLVMTLHGLSKCNGVDDLYCERSNEMEVGTGLMVTARLAGVIVTLIGVNSYNERLRSKLGLNPQRVMPTR